MPLLEKWTPLRELELMDRRMRRFFGDLGLVPPVTPAADIYETDGELVVELEVPPFSRTPQTFVESVALSSPSPRRNRKVFSCGRRGGASSYSRSVSQCIAQFIRPARSEHPWIP
jgi:hypothetical protein